MLRELLEEKFLDKEIEIYLNGHIFYHPKNPTWYNGVREYLTWEISPVKKIDNNKNPDESGQWSKFRCVKSKIVKVLEIIHEIDYEVNEWKLRCVGKKGKEYLILLPE